MDSSLEIYKLPEVKKALCMIQFEINICGEKVNSSLVKGILLSNLSEPINSLCCLKDAQEQPAIL